MTLQQTATRSRAALLNPGRALSGNAATPTELLRDSAMPILDRAAATTLTRELDAIVEQMELEILKPLRNALTVEDLDRLTLQNPLLFQYPEFDT